MTDEEVENSIREFFYDNYEFLRLDGGHSLTEDVKQSALQQVLQYWRKLRDVAEKITQTEVKLSLPDQTTPQGRTFSIEGVVDIVKEEGETWMYDIKTHDLDYIRTNKDLYEKQLNVYAYIWQNLRGNELEHTAIISTAIPDSLRHALRPPQNPKVVEHEFAKWEPLIELKFEKERVKKTIEDFGVVVDLIEENKFSPPPVDKLKESVAGTRSNELFGTRVCRNCDARFSCSSYREFAMERSGKSFSNYKKYFNDYGNDADQEDWINGNINMEVINSPKPDIPQ